MTEERRQYDSVLNQKLDDFISEMRANHKENRADIQELQENWKKLTWGYKIFLGICAATAALITALIKLYGFMGEHWKS